MLVLALAATLIGFGLLVVALVTGTLWLAVACIAVCIIGGLFLLADLFGLGDALTLRRGRRAAGHTADAAPDHDDDPDDAGYPVAVDSSGSADPSDTEVTTEFPRIGSSEPVVSLDDPDSAWHGDIGDAVAAGLSESEPADTAPRRSTHSRDDDPDRMGTSEPPRHGRHGSDDVDPAPRRTPRHGSPD